MKPSSDPSNLEALLNSCRRNGRPARFPKPEPRYFSDAERFRWWFRYGGGARGLTESKSLPLSKIRDILDAEMRNHPEQVHT